MAKVEVRVSDLSGAMIQDDAELQQITVEHPDFSQALILDASVADLEGRLPQPQDFITLTINDQRFLMSIQEFNELFIGDEGAEEVLERVAREQHPRRRGRRGGQRRQRVDWSSPERAGLDHPGRISQAEKAYVRDHLDEVNERRIAAGQPELDPSDPETAERYGLTTEPIEDAEVIEETPSEV